MKISPLENYPLYGNCSTIESDPHQYLHYPCDVTQPRRLGPLRLLRTVLQTTNRKGGVRPGYEARSALCLIHAVWCRQLVVGAGPVLCMCMCMAGTVRHSVPAR